MIGAVTGLVKSKEGKMFLALAGGVVLVLTGINYYYQIKMTKLRIEDLKQENQLLSKENEYLKASGV